MGRRVSKRGEVEFKQVLGDVKRNWIKVTYKWQTKRLNNVPNDIEELKIFIWTRFGELRDKYNDPGSLEISAELPGASEIPILSS